MSIFIPTYFSPIAQFSALWNKENIVFEVEDNYQKQSYRNRCYIAGPNGRQLLSIPVSFPSYDGRKKTKDAKIDYSESWQKQHIKSLEAAYNSSPFFELLKPEIEEVIGKNHTFLLDLNIDTFLLVKDVLSLEIQFVKSLNFELDMTDDFRYMANAKKTSKAQLETYYQVFKEKNGFLQNLSILDLLFMEGANSISFLEKNQLTLNIP